MRIAGFVSKADQIEVDYIKSVHLVSRWVHEMFEDAPVRGVPAGNAAPVAPDGVRRR